MQVEHKTEKGVVIFVKVPDDSYDHYIHKKNLLFDLESDKGCDIIRLQSLNWQLIGLTSEVTEEQCKSMFGIYAPEYLSLNKVMLHQAMFESKVYGVNPLGEKTNPVKYIRNIITKTKVRVLNEKYNEWNKAQSRTGKWIVLFKPNEK